MTSWNDIAYIEKYLFGELSDTERIIFESKLSQDTSLNVKVGLQRKLFDLLRQYNRRKLKEQVAEIHERIFNDPKSQVRKEVFNIFK